MDSQIIVAAHVPVEITKPHKVRLRYTVWEAEVCFGVLNGMKGQIIQKKKKKFSNTRYRGEPQYTLWVVLGA